MMRTQQELNSVVNRAIETRKSAPARRTTGLMQSLASIPPELYYNAKANGEDPRDPDLLKYELRHNAWMRPHTQGAIRSTLQHLTPSPFPAKRKTRFGVSTFHKVYA